MTRKVGKHLEKSMREKTNFGKLIFAYKINLKLTLITIKTCKQQH
jgi:hypothetical protein